MKRIRAYLAGDYVPKSVLDIQYDGKTNGTVAEELLRGFLRLITDANPTI
jgi:hypothetical protein